MPLALCQEVPSFGRLLHVGMWGGVGTWVQHTKMFRLLVFKTLEAIRPGYDMLIFHDRTTPPATSRSSKCPGS